MSRRLAREYAVQFLFSMDFNMGENMDEALEVFFDSEEMNEGRKLSDTLKKNDLAFAETIIRGCVSNLDEVDGLIRANSQGWTKERIAKVDLAILRLALFEILHMNDIPDSVAVNEAVELAKKYSTEESGSFINGILGKILRDKAVKGV